ncbi:MAG: redoxin domain-containing protein [Bacilli bacterium]|nr:redoxin domain-containing protein [Bacilli bacterium]
MKKYLMIIVMIMFILGGCQSKNDDNSFSKIAITNETISSPKTPSSIMVNGKAIVIDLDKLLKVDDVIKGSELIPPTGTFDTMKPVPFNDLKGWKVIHIIPSLDTPVCSLQTRQLDYASSEFKDVIFMSISADLPFALQHFVDDNKIMGMKVYSDYQGYQFLKNNELFMKQYSLATRAIIIVDENNKVKYVEYASEVTKELDLAQAINYLRQNYQK